jgi:hypothetical protein
MDKGVIMLLASMQEAARTFVEGLAESMAREGAQDLGQLPTAVYAPIHSQLDRWGAVGGC